MKPSRLIVPTVTLVALFAAACGSTADGGASGMQTPGGMMMSPTHDMHGMGNGSPDLADCREVEGGKVTVVAQNLEYDTDCIEAAADQAFVITLENRDGAPHNITIEDQVGEAVFDGENVTQGSIDYDIPALAAGEYPFHCHVHPNMTGVLVVDAS